MFSTLLIAADIQSQKQEQITSTLQSAKFGEVADLGFKENAIKHAVKNYKEVLEKSKVTKQEKKDQLKNIETLVAEYNNLPYADKKWSTSILDYVHHKKFDQPLPVSQDHDKKAAAMAGGAVFAAAVLCGMLFLLK